MTKTERYEIERTEIEIIGRLYIPIFDFVGNETFVGTGSIPVETEISGYDTNGIKRFVLYPERN